jgi:hypothetical protein
MAKVSDIFEVRYGHSLELNRLTIVRPEFGIPFVSRKMGDNGISAFVEPIKGVEPAPAGYLSCALGGNGVLTTHLQEQPFYVGRDVALLKPRSELTKAQLLFYCLSIKSNRFRYSYGRQANRTLKDLVVPDIVDLPGWVNDFDVNMFDGGSAPVSSESVISLEISKWVKFRYDEIFEIRNGYYNKKPPVSTSKDDVPFIGASEKCNGVTSYVAMCNLESYSRDGRVVVGEALERKLFPGRCITVPNNGASVAEAFYQPRPFTCTHDVTPLYLKDRSVLMSPEIGLFLAAIIRAEKYRWSYGRKWRPMRMCNSTINLPVTSDGEPDWDFMIEYIRTLPFSLQVVVNSAESFSGE